MHWTPGASMTNTLLSVNNLTTVIKGEHENKTVVGGISFSIATGETFALVGESGSGKSITAFSITRLLPAAASVVDGQVLFEGSDLLRMTEAQMRRIRGTGISMIFQEPMNSLNPVMKIGKQIAEAVLNANPNTSKAEVNAEVISLLNLVRIEQPEARQEEYPHQFSGGMRQRVMIAIALAGEPKLLIADEPTTALDVTIQAEVLHLIADIQKKRKMAVLLITHDLGVVHQIADRIGVMRHGQLLEVSPKNTFFTAPKHAYSQQLFDAIPSIAKRGQRLSSPDDGQAASHSSAELTVNRNHETILTLTDVKTYFPIKQGIFKRTVGHVKAVDGVSLALKQGHTLALVGESGSGKSTLAKTVIRLLDPYAGHIAFAGRDISTIGYRAMNALRTDLQIIFQDPYSSMNPRMLVRDILSEGMIALGIKKNTSEREARLIELLTLVGLDAGSLNRYPHQFSGGQRQRIAIARALAVDPKVIVCDEPTSALDVSVQAQVLNLLKDLQERLGLAYLFITHNISVVGYMADDVAVMYKGKIVEEGPVNQVLLQPEHEYTRTLMSAVPDLYRASSSS
ncbi:dipeptide ABC transporter ATP-binding protein [bacterium]|nr:dipeptide ABC transporter ATP-binding protein [bacterium]